MIEFLALLARNADGVFGRDRCWCFEQKDAAAKRCDNLSRQHRSDSRPFWGKWIYAPAGWKFARIDWAFS